MNKAFYFLLILAASLLASLFLVQMNHDSRRRASNIEITALFLPESSSVDSGQRFHQFFLLDTAIYRLNAVDTRIKFDPQKLKVISVTPLSSRSNLIPGSKYFFSEDSHALDTSFDNQLGTINLLGVNLNRPEEVSSGVVYLLRIEFEALTAHHVQLSLDPAYPHQVTGYNFISPTSTPTLTPTPAISANPPGILKFNLSFTGVSSSATCVDWPISVLVVSDIGVTKFFPSVGLTKIDSASSLAVYQSQLPLVDFDHHRNLSVFIRSPRHLQTKYGVNGQSSVYNQKNGQISVTTDHSTTPLYDFTAFPLPAGDITDRTSSQSDGVINGLDFAQVKSHAVRRLKVESGTTLLSDLDGNCEVNSVDITTLMQALRDQIDQVY